ncbi:lipid-A-disaccharide synthase-related protein [candidate division WOR-3 bacterium]|nr:lipid-A-disaccharide synthase-related protein [candidate division WOR-3 bacterium]
MKFSALVFLWQIDRAQLLIRVCDFLKVDISINVRYDSIVLKASVIIPTYNRAYILKHCLSYLLNQTTQGYEIIVIDDASQDETAKLISRFQIPDSRLRYIRLEKQVGPYVARNIGIEQAKGELIIFLDSDVLVHPNFVLDHIRIHKSNKKIWVQGMVHHIRNLNQVNFKLYYPNALCIGTFITQNASVRKKWFLEIGGFEEFGSKIGYKDVDLGIRLKKIGLNPVHPLFRCKAYHIDGPSKKENLQEFFNKHQKRGKSAYFLIKRHGKLGKKFAHTKKALLISRFFQTDRWVERGLRFLESSRDSPVLPLFPICKMLMKYHYRAQGILEARSEKREARNKKQEVDSHLITYNSQLTTPKASVIIVTYNRERLLRYCLRALLSQTSQDYEIVVIDDGSTDGTYNIPEIKKVRYFKNDTQSGQPFSRNRGIKQARGEIIIFVDSDVLVDPRFVDDHTAPHNLNDKLIVQGLVRHIRHPKNAGGFSLKIDGFSKGGLVTQNVSIKKKWLLQVGLMDEKFGISMGYEDTDLGRRLKKIGLKTVCGFRKCKAYHVDGYPTCEKFKITFQKRYQWSKNIVYFGSKYGNRVVKTNKVLIVSKLLQLSKWAEKEAAIRLLAHSVDFPIFFITPILKEIMKYHYRAKGIKEVQSKEFRVKSKERKINSQLSTLPQDSANNSQLLLFLSNCYGEDRSAALIAQELRKVQSSEFRVKSKKRKIDSQLSTLNSQLIGAPLISEGEEYEKRNIPLLIKGKLPPSGGFPRNFVDFLKDATTSSYIPIRYYIVLKKVRREINQAVVVGDVFLLLLAWLGLKKRLIFLAPAKSDYQNPHFKFEHWAMRKICIKVFTHDEYTAKNLRKESVPALFVGNPMVDGLEETHNSQLITHNSQTLVGILPGSRKEAYKNFLKILLVVEQISNKKEGVNFAAAIPSSLDLQKLVTLLELQGWQYPASSIWIQKGNNKVWLLQDAFVDIIKQSDVVIGLSGTANEQTAFLGKPIVSFKGCGPQTSVTRMRNQEKLLGGCLKFISDFPEGVVGEVLKLLDDKELRQKRGEIGKKRMGPSGGAKNIAKFINDLSYRPA